MNKNRSYFLKKLINMFGNDRIALNIEKSVFNSVITRAKSKNIERSWDNSVFTSMYNMKCRSIDFNLNNPKNETFKIKVSNGDIDSRYIGFMESHEMYPELYEEIFSKLEARERRLLDNSNSGSCSDGLFTCPKCDSKKTEFYSLQTRSADEPMTNYVTCLDCGHKWKD